MANLENIQNRIRKIDDIQHALFCHVVGFDTNINDLFINKNIDPNDTDSINDEIVRLSIEITKAGYGLSDDFKLMDEYILRYFCICSMIMVFKTLQKPAQTLSSLDYICSLFDNNCEQYDVIASQIEDKTFNYYYDLLMDSTQYLLSPLTNTLEILLVAFLDKVIPNGYVEEMTEVMCKNIEKFIEENDYNKIISQIIL